jgi:hypothetical protein
MTVVSGRLAFASGKLVAITSVTLLLLVAAGPALPQSAPPPQGTTGVKEQADQQGQPPQGEVAPQPTPQPSESPGLVDQMGKLLEKSLSVLPPLKSPTETIGDLGTRAKDAAKDAGDALSRLARPGSMVSGRTMCPLSANGMPDCKLGADKLCQGKGYKEGKSLNTDSTQTCSAKVLIPGRQRKPEDCRSDTYVTTALCQ